MSRLEDYLETIQPELINTARLFGMEEKLPLFRMEAEEEKDLYRICFRYEDAAAEAVHFALIFQFEGDKKATRHVLYNCTATRPAASGSTKQETVEPQTETVTISAGTIFVPALELDIPKASTTEETTAAIYDAWFTNVYIPGAAA